MDLSLSDTSVYDVCIVLVWSPDKERQQHLGTYEKGKFSTPISDTKS